jgi:hypothetical protein
MPSIALDWSRFTDCLAVVSTSKLQMLLYIFNSIYFGALLLTSQFLSMSNPLEQLVFTTVKSRIRKN